MGFHGIGLCHGESDVDVESILVGRIDVESMEGSKKKGNIAQVCREACLGRGDDMVMMMKDDRWTRDGQEKQKEKTASLTYPVFPGISIPCMYFQGMRLVMKYNDC